MAVLNDEALRLMSRQFGLITRPQLLELGHTADQTSGLVYRGVLERVAHGTYRLRGGGVPAEQPLMVAVLRCRPQARLTGHVVLGLLRVEGFNLSDPIIVLVPPWRSVQNVTFTVRSCSSWDTHPARWGSLPMVTASRALVDVGRHERGKRLRAGFDSARWLGLTSPERLHRCASSLPGDPGAEAVLGLLAAGVFEHESEGERNLAPLLVSVVPRPEVNVWVSPHIRVDYLWRDVSFIVEYDGEKAHGTALGREQDRQRDQQIEALGYVIEHITKEDLRHPEETRARILAVRAALLARRGRSA